MERTPILYADGKQRCPWPGTDPLYLAYHDTDWGVPEYNGRALFEKLILDGFQAGLSWITILRKRENFRLAFDGFDAAKIARYDARKTQNLMLDAGIVRNRAKIDAAVTSARAFLTIEDREGFAPFLWKFLDGRPTQNSFRSMDEVPTATPIAEAMSKALIKEGFRFVGPTIVYAFMQATGMVNDHLVGCFRREACAALGASGFRG